MATGGDMVRGALRKLGVKSAESPIEGFEYVQGVETFNDMMSEWEDSGIHLGFEPISVETDTVRVPRGTHDGIKAQLALRLAPDYTRPVSVELAKNAEDGMNRILRIATGPINVTFPSTLPLGSGNECQDYEDDRFFPQNETENF